MTARDEMEITIGGSEHADTEPLATAADDGAAPAFAPAQAARPKKRRSFLFSTPYGAERKPWVLGVAEASFERRRRRRSAFSIRLADAAVSGAASGPRGGVAAPPRMPRG